MIQPNTAGCSTGSPAIGLLRLALFAAIIATLSLAWYETDAGRPGSGWDLAFESAGWTLGLCFLPYALFLIAGALSFLRPRCPAIWLYRAALAGWTVIAGLITAGDFRGYTGAWGSALAAFLALAVETVDFARARRQAKHAG